MSIMNPTLQIIALQLQSGSFHYDVSLFFSHSRQIKMEILIPTTFLISLSLGITVSVSHRVCGSLGVVLGS